MADAFLRSPAVFAAFDGAELTDWPFDPGQVDEGNPMARGVVVWRSTDETRAAGFWECTAGAFTRTYSWAETAVILSGAAVVRTTEQERKLEPGALVILPVGITATWIVPDRVRKVFHLAADIPLPV